MRRDVCLMDRSCSMLGMTHDKEMVKPLGNADLSTNDSEWNVALLNLEGFRCLWEREGKFRGTILVK